MKTKNQATRERDAANLMLQMIEFQEKHGTAALAHVLSDATMILAENAYETDDAERGDALNLAAKTLDDYGSNR